MTRREFVGGAVALAALATSTTARSEGADEMYGLIGKMTMVAGQRDAFIEILLAGIEDMPGCLSYVVAKDPDDENALWITEVWDSQASHEASLSLPSVQEAIAKGRPLIAGFGERFVTTPVGGHGLVATKTG